MENAYILYYDFGIYFLFNYPKTITFFKARINLK
jgi:hypothetical protein